MEKEWRASRVPSLHRLQPRRATVYRWIWIAAAVMTVAWALVMWGNWTESKQTATAAPTSLYSYVDVHPTGGRGIPGATTTTYVTKYTFEVQGFQYSGAQQRSVPDDYAVPAFVCYDPRDPKSSALGFPGETGCGVDGSDSPFYWPVQAAVLGLLFAGTAVAFRKWRLWRVKTDLIG